MRCEVLGDVILSALSRLRKDPTSNFESSEGIYETVFRHFLLEKTVYTFVKAPKAMHLFLERCNCSVRNDKIEKMSNDLGPSKCFNKCRVCKGK